MFTSGSELEHDISRENNYCRVALFYLPGQMNSTRMPLGSWHIMCQAGPWPSNSGANSIGVPLRISVV